MSDFETIRELGEGQPAPRPEARDAARAALLARFDAGVSTTARPKARRRFLGVRNLALAGSLAGVAVALPLALGTGGGSGVRPEVASAADLDHLAELVPRLEIAGGWQITDTEASPEGGATRLHYEGDPTNPTADIEIRWHTTSVEEAGEQLEAEGFEAAGTQPTETHDSLGFRELTADLGRGEDGETFLRRGTAQVYAAPADALGQRQVGAVWRDEGWTFELRTRVESLDLLERRLEKIEVLGPDEWLVALQPGGAEWLVKSLNGTVQKLENVRIERPDGAVVLESQALIKTNERLEKLAFTAPFPIIHREGDSIRVEIARAPG